MKLLKKNYGRLCFKRITQYLYKPFCQVPYEEIETDVLIIGAGPSGLSTAIKLAQLAKQNNKNIDITILEKGSEIGAHIISGNVFEPSALNELIPDWQDRDPPISTKVTKDHFHILTANYKFSIPESLLPPSIHNKHNYIISLSQLTRWLGKQVEEYGVNIFTGQAGSRLVFNSDNNSVEGAITNDFGINKKGEKKPNFTPGIQIKAKCTVLSEGCRGSLTEDLKKRFNLKGEGDQIYGLGLKEVWEIDTEKNKHFSSGLVQHTTYWPLDSKTYGGSFMYHMDKNIIHIGMVVGLDYKNPYLNPYEEFQRFKTHKDIRKYLEHGKCIEYGARTLNEGGYYAIPKISFNGGMIVGCAAGFLNVAKVKGTHNAMKSGILAAESIYESFCNNEDKLVFGEKYSNYEEKLRKSSINNELYETRNFKGAFEVGGLFFGMFHGLVTSITKGKEFWKFISKHRDSTSTEKKEKHKKIDYPKHDGILTFDLLENLSRSGTNHDHDQPSHLRLKDNGESSLLSYNDYDGPEERFCPAKVYEFVQNEKNEVKLQINSQNCVHCKCCSIKMINEYIDWNVPEGGGGPKYNFM